MKFSKPNRIVACATASLLVAAQAVQATPIIFDDFNVNLGHFTSNIYNASGSDANIANTSTSARVTTDSPVEGTGQQKLVINASTPGTAMRIRHLSGGGSAGANIAFTTSAGVDGWIGFYLKADATNDPNWNVQLYLEGASNNGGVPKTVICDGTWHLYEWNLDDTSGGADGWGNVASIVTGSPTVSAGSHTVDSIVFRNATGPASSTIFLDFYAKSDSGSVSNVLATPCIATSGVTVSGPIATNSNQVTVNGVSATAAKVTVYQNNIAVGSMTNGITAGNNQVTVSGLVKGGLVAATQTVGSQESCIPASVITVGGGSSPRIRVAATIRQSGLNIGPVGSNGGGSSLNLYWLHSTGANAAGGLVISPSTNWQTVAFYPTDSKFVWNGALTFNPDGSDPNQYGTIDGFALAMDDLTDTGPYQIYFDNLRNGSIMIQDFEDETNNAVVQFPAPGSSGSTSGNLLTSPNTSVVTTNYAQSGTNSDFVYFQFNSAGTAKYVRLTALATTGNHPTPNPQVDLTQPILIDMLVLPVNQTNAHSLGTVSPATAFHLTNCLGSSATFGVTVTPPDNTSPAYTYTWKKNGSTIAGATTATLITNGVSAAAAGTYSVVVSDGTASATLNYLLTVLPPAIVDSQPTGPGFAEAAGTSWSFFTAASAPPECPCANAPAFAYQWRLNGANIAGATDSTLNLNSLTLSDAGFYDVVISNTCNGGTVTTATAQLPVYDPNAPVAAACGTGLLGLYWTNQTSVNAFTGSPTWTNTDAMIDFDWTTGGPFPSPFDTSTNSFTIRWFGQVQAPYDNQVYTFYTKSDDGVRLWVNGQLLIDKWVTQSGVEWSGSILLTTNSPVDIVVQYFEQTGNASVNLSWSAPSVYKATVPQQQFCAALDTAPVPPLITLTSPANNASVALGATVTNTAVVNPETSTIEKVEFYSNGTNLLGTVLAAPFTLSWTPGSAGTYNITARIYYNGVSTLNTPINKLTVTSVTVAAANSVISSGPGSDLTIRYSGGQAVNYVLLRSTTLTTPLSSWTPIATNSGSLSVSNFVVTPSGAVNYYRVTSRTY